MTKEMNNKELQNIIETYEPKGLFWAHIGVDHSTGDSWTEEFDTLESCIEWLNGENVEGSIQPCQD